MSPDALSTPEAAEARRHLAAVADQIGCLPKASCPTPQALETLSRQCGSKILDPLLWAAARNSSTHPTLEVLREACGIVTSRISVGQWQLSATHALQAAWVQLRLAMRSWGVHSPAELTAWLARNAPSSPQYGSNLSPEAIDYMLMNARDQNHALQAITAILEQVTLHMAEMPDFLRAPPATTPASDLQAEPLPDASADRPACAETPAETGMDLGENTGDGHPPNALCSIPAAGTRLSAAAARDLFDLAARVGVTSNDNIPQPAQDILNRHGWSPFFVPWIWSAADEAPSDAIVEWAASAASGVQDVFSFLRGDLAAPEAFRSSWEALRGGLRALGIRSTADLAAWWVSNGFGFSQARPYTYVNRGAQEFALLCE